MRLTRHLTLAAAVAGVLATAAPATAETVTIDHLPTAEDYGDVGSLTPTYQTWGQVITAPDHGGRWELTEAALIFLARDGLGVRFEVRRWAGDRSTGPALWSSGRLTPSEDLLYHRIDFAPTGVVVDAGEQIVLAATTLGEANPALASGKFGAYLDDRYAGGGLRTSFATTPDELDDAPWRVDWANLDLTFEATFESVPEPEPEPDPEPAPSASSAPAAPEGPVEPVATDAPSAVPPAPAAQPAAAPGTIAEPAPAAAVATSACRVPALKGLSRKQARKRLQRAGCRLGAVRGDGRRVARQGARPGRTLPGGATVWVRLR